MIVVMEIGCLECNNPSRLIGMYATRADALSANPDMDFADEVGSAWNGEAMIVGFEGAGP